MATPPPRPVLLFLCIMASEFPWRNRFRPFSLPFLPLFSQVSEIVMIFRSNSTKFNKRESALAGRDLEFVTAKLIVLYLRSGTFTAKESKLLLLFSSEPIVESSAE